jgi:hypothetical protein
MIKPNYLLIHLRALCGLTVVFSCLLISIPVVADGKQTRPGNTRGYAVDILTDTFGYGADDIDADVDAVFQGCPQRDCIPSIDRPEFLKASDVDFLDRDDIVLSLTHENITRAYPTRILDRHEIVNDRFGETPVAVTYCPLCGSGLAFVRVLGGEEVQLGVSGLLHNNDLIMYDRKTKSLWQQITGQAIAGPMRGSTLQSLPVTMSLWKEWKTANPGAEVLALPSRRQRYLKKTYGDYDSSDRLLFPVANQDARLHVKKVIHGVEIGALSIAVEDKWLKKKGSWEHDINGKILRLDVNDAGGVTGSIEGEPVSVHRMYWFAWYSFHPDTSLIDKRNH